MQSRNRWIDIRDQTLMGMQMLNFANLQHDPTAVEKVRLAAFRTRERMGYYLEHLFREDRPRVDRNIVLKALSVRIQKEAKLRELPEGSFKVCRITDIPLSQFVLKKYSRCTELRINDILPLNMTGSRSERKITIRRVIIATAEPVISGDPYDRNIRQIIPEVLTGCNDYNPKFDFSVADYDYVVCPQSDIREEYERFCSLPTHLDLRSARH